MRTLLSIAVVLFSTGHARGDERPRMILDADTANEIDDHYAVLRVLFQDRFDVVGVTSAQWLHYMGDADSVEASQRENETLLRLAKSKLPTPIGSTEPMGRPWGGDQPKDSPAARFIIEQAHATPDGQRLTLVCIGASTNAASAIRIDPTIAAKIDLYVLGFRYDFETSVWNKNSFNVRRDLNAADYLLNRDDVRLHVMPASVAVNLKFNRDDTFEKLSRRGELGQYLIRRWNEHAPDQPVRIIWDLALVQAILHPKMATSRRVDTPPENTPRQITVYETIDAAAMQADFWNTFAESQ